MSETVSRRDFVAASTAVAGSLAFNAGLYAQGKHTMKVGLVGCGGRGKGAVGDVLNADSDVQIVAFCDVFEDCSLWTGFGHEWMLVGTRGARGPVSAERFARQWDDPVVGPRLAAAGLKTPAHVGATFLADAAQLASLAESRIREQLGKPTEFDFTDLPLRDVIQFLKDQHRIEMQLDEKRLAESNVTGDSPITMQVRGISLRSALRLLLSRLSEDATFVVADEFLLITTRQGDRLRKTVRIYDVSDFVEPQVAVGGNPYGAR